MIRGRRTLAGALGVAIVLAIAPAAHAGTIRYAAPDTAAYDVQDNGNGIVKITYRRCLVVGQRTSVAFNVTTDVQRDATAVWRVLRVEGDLPVVAFDPDNLALRRGDPQTFDVRFTFTPNDANNGVTSLRFKLDPQNGEGLGQGAGVMVRIPCVLNPPPEEEPPPTTPGSPPPPPRDTTVPTRNETPETPTRSTARCVSTPRRLRVRAGQLNIVRVVVRNNGTRIRRALVTLRGAGEFERVYTNGDGVATLRFRPERRGRIVIQSDVCFGADRITVRGAQTTGTAETPRFTG